MNAFSLSGLFLSCTCLILLILITRAAKSRIHYVWALFNIAVAIWGLGSFFLSKQFPFENVLVWLRIAHAGVIFIAVFFFHLVYLLCNLTNKKLLFACYFQGIVFLILNFTNYLVAPQKITLFYNSFYFDKSSGWLIPLFFSIWISFIIYGHFVLFQTFLHSSGFKKNQILYFFVGMFTGFSGGITNFFPTFGIPFYPIGNFTIPLYCIIVTYAILKYNLLDIKVALTRTGLFIIVYTLVLGLPFTLAWYAKSWLIDVFGVNWWSVPLITMAGLATLGPFFYIRLQQKAEDTLLKEQRRYQNTLKNAAIGMTRIRSLRKLLSLITHIVTKTVRINYAAIYLLDEQNSEYNLQVFRDTGRVPAQKLSADSRMVKWLMAKQQPLVYEEIKRLVQDARDPELKEIEEQMRQIMASLIVPSLLDQKLTGFIVLGDKLSGQIYSPDDLNVFQVLASQAALAIENAQFYEEAKEMQAQIAQAEKMATIGTMADGLSHQINNRFYALSLIAGDTIDTIKMTDTSRCSDEIKEMIRQINSALDRIQNNVIQGGEVVKGLLKYTRKGEQGLEPLRLDQILDSTLEMVKYKIKLPEIDIVRAYPPETPMIKGNLVQMQEVFFNFIDNAYDAIVERRNALKEPNFRGKITVSAKTRGEMLEVTVQDNGMGVKKEDVKKIFTPFFTTKVSSRKGTGLGLYVIHNIITDTHGGKISFESAYLVGTQFVLELPLASEGACLQET